MTAKYRRVPPVHDCGHVFEGKALVPAICPACHQWVTLSTFLDLEAMKRDDIHPIIDFRSPYAIGEEP